jgi:hypothetical protein
MLYESEDELVSHPKHYQSESGLEVIDVIEAFTANLRGVEATDTGNIIKYICRWKEKEGLRDLEKILWYTTHLIEVVKREGKITRFHKEENHAPDSGQRVIGDTSAKKRRTSETVGSIGKVPK